MPEVTQPKKTLMIDFDGVIHLYSKGWQDGSIYDEPAHGAKEMMEKLNKKYRVVIFTTRLNADPFGEYDGDGDIVLSDNLPKEDQLRIFVEMNEKRTKARVDIKDWLFKHGFIFGTHYDGMTFLKQGAVAYIDDRAIKFSNWNDTDILNLITLPANQFFPHGESFFA